MAHDRYQEWLGVPQGDRPPHYYDLLGVPVFCDDQARIEQAARSQMRKVRVYQAHPDRAARDVCHRMLSEIATACVSLVNADKKKGYDRELASRLKTELPQPVAAEAAEEAPRRRASRRERSKVRRHAEARATLASARDAARLTAFEQLAYTHLLRWTLSEDEEALLAAEARAYGISPQEARRIIREVALRAERELRRSRAVTKWTIGIGVSAASLCLLVGAGIGLARQLRSWEADKLANAARELVAKGHWDAARTQVRRARELNPYRATDFDQLDREIDVAECEFRLEAADHARARADWDEMYAYLEQAKGLVSNHRGIDAVRDSAIDNVTTRARSLLSESEQLRDHRQWRKAEQRIEEAVRLLKAARIPPSRFTCDRTALVKAVKSAEKSDWAQLAAKFQAQFDDWQFDEAVSAANEAARFHASQKEEINRWRQKVSRRREELAQLDKRLDTLVASNQFGAARTAVDSADFPERLRLPRVQKINSAWRQRAEAIVGQVCELADRAGRPNICDGSCAVLLADPALREPDSTLTSEPPCTLSAGADSVATEEELVLTTLQLKDHGPLAGEIVHEDAIRILVRPVVNERPLSLGPEVQEVKVLDVEAREQVRTLSPEQTDAVRRRLLVLELDHAIHQAEHLRALEIVGQLKVRGADDLVQSILREKRKELERSVWRIASYCPNCIGRGTIACDNCQGTGRVDGLVACKRCDGKGWYQCPKCHGNRKVKCTRCKGSGRPGYLYKKVGERRLGGGWKQDVYGWVDCPDCSGGWITCPACKGSGEISPCRTCNGTGEVPGKIVCPKCNGRKMVPCPICGGSGERRD